MYALIPAQCTSMLFRDTSQLLQLKSVETTTAELPPALRFTTADFQFFHLQFLQGPPRYVHLRDKVSGVSFTTKTSWQNYSCISYKCEISQIYILKVKKSKIKLLISACILYGQLHKKNIKFAILSSEMLANDWVPILVVFLWMDLDSGFNSLTSNLLNVWKNSNVAFAVRIYCYFPLFPSVDISLPSDIYTVLFPSFYSFSSSCSSFILQ